MSTPNRKAGEFIPLEQRRQLIAEAAYFRAERRSFQGGNPVEDWLEAEREISQLYDSPPVPPPTGSEIDCLSDIPPAAPPLRGALVFLEGSRSNQNKPQMVESA